MAAEGRDKGLAGFSGLCAQPWSYATPLTRGGDPTRPLHDLADLPGAVLGPPSPFLQASPCLEATNPEGSRPSGHGGEPELPKQRPTRPHATVVPARLALALYSQSWSHQGQAGVSVSHSPHLDPAPSPFWLLLSTSSTQQDHRGRLSRAPADMLQGCQHPCLPPRPPSAGRAGPLWPRCPGALLCSAQRKRPIPSCHPYKIPTKRPVTG